MALWSTSTLEPMFMSLKVASLATLAGLFFGVPSGWFLSRLKGPWRAILDALIALPLLLPPVALGLFLLWILSMQVALQPLLLTWKAAVLAAFIVSLPIQIRAAEQAFAGVPRAAEDSALLVGSLRHHFWYIHLPLAMRGILEGALLSFCRCVGEFGATVMVAGMIPGSTETLATGIYQSFLSGDLGRAGLLSGLTAGVGFLGYFLLRTLRLKFVVTNYNH